MQSGQNHLLPSISPGKQEKLFQIGTNLVELIVSMSLPACVRKTFCAVCLREDFKRVRCHTVCVCVCVCVCVSEWVSDSGLRLRTQKFNELGHMPMSWMGNMIIQLQINKNKQQTNVISNIKRDQMSNTNLWASKNQSVSAHTLTRHIQLISLHTHARARARTRVRARACKHAPAPHIHTRAQCACLWAPRRAHHIADAAEIAKS